MFVLLFFLFSLSLFGSADDSSFSLQQAILSPFNFLMAQNEQEKKDAEDDVAKPTPDTPQETSPESVPGIPESVFPSKVPAEEKEAKIMLEPETNTIELDLDNADLSTLVEQVRTIFNVTFISDDMIEPLPPEVRTIKGNKISFKTNKPLSKEEAWNAFVMLMDVAKFSVIPYNAAKTVYKIVSTEKAKKQALRSFIDVHSDALPDSDEVIRYVYFVENTNLDALMPVIDGLRSVTSDRIILKNHKAFVLTDKAYNIKMLLKIVEDLDSDYTPEMLSVIKLRHADARQVYELYQNLMPKEEAMRMTARQQPTTLYFPENVRLFPYPYANLVVLMGPRDSLEKIETFITTHIDVPLEQMYTPFFIYKLKYADAETIADILNNMAQFGKSDESGRAGGIKGDTRYLGLVSFVAEKETNSVIMKGKYEDYLIVKDIVDKLDEQQPQISVQFLITSVEVDNNKSLGAQIRSKQPGPSMWGTNLEFQTSGLYGTSKIVPDTTASLGVERILGNLLTLINGAVSGTTIVSLGLDKFGVWGIFEMLETITNAEVISNPFFITTNKTPTLISVGEERRVVTATISGASSNTEARGSDRALLEVKTTPQINSDGKIVLNLDITINDFINPANSQNNADKTLKNVKTNLVLADGEVQAMSGFIKNKTIYGQSKTPILGDIPFLGWLFKNKKVEVIDQHLLILVTVKIVDTKDTTVIDLSTDQRIKQYHGALDSMNAGSSRRDPVHKMFFEARNKSEDLVENYIFERNKKSRKRQRMRKKRSMTETA